MDLTAMIVVGAVILLLPFVLMLAFNAGDRRDARGRRLNPTWRSTRRRRPS